MIFCERVGGVSGDDVTDPTERAAAANPKAGGDDQPENAGKYAAVVKLAHAGNQKTKNACGKWIAHDYLRAAIHYEGPRGFVRRKFEWNGKCKIVTRLPNGTLAIPE